MSARSRTPPCTSRSATRRPGRCSGNRGRRFSHRPLRPIPLSLSKSPRARPRPARSAVSSESSRGARPSASRCGRGRSASTRRSGRDASPPRSTVFSTATRERFSSCLSRRAPHPTRTTLSRPRASRGGSRIATARPSSTASSFPKKPPGPYRRLRPRSGNAAPRSRLRRPRRRALRRPGLDPKVTALLQRLGVPEMGLALTEANADSLCGRLEAARRSGRPSRPGSVRPPSPCGRSPKKISTAPDASSRSLRPRRL